MKALLTALLLLFTTPLYAGDSRALNPKNDPTISAWFEALRQPDSPRVSCCGEADAFEADEWEQGADGTYMAIITDGRGALANGLRVRIPENKHYTSGQRNPTGHGIVFLHVITLQETMSGENPYDLKDVGKILVYCYVEPTGA